MLQWPRLPGLPNSIFFRYKILLRAMTYLFSLVKKYLMYWRKIIKLLLPAIPADQINFLICKIESGLGQLAKYLSPSDSVQTPG